MPLMKTTLPTPAAGSPAPRRATSTIPAAHLGDRQSRDARRGDRHAHRDPLATVTRLAPAARAVGQPCAGRAAKPSGSRARRPDRHRVARTARGGAALSCRRSRIPRASPTSRTRASSRSFTTTPGPESRLTTTDLVCLPPSHHLPGSGGASRYSRRSAEVDAGCADQSVCGPFSSSNWRFTSTMRRCSLSVSTTSLVSLRRSTMPLPSFSA